MPEETIVANQGTADLKETLEAHAKDVLAKVQEAQATLRSELGQDIASLKETEERVKAFIEASENGDSAGELDARVRRIGQVVATVEEDVRKMRDVRAEATMSGSADLPRLQASGNRYNGLPLTELANVKTRMLLTEASESQRHMDNINSAVASTQIDRAMVEAYFGALETRMAPYGGLDEASEAARDIALGRMRATDSIVENERPASNMLYDGIDAALTTATGSGGPLVPTILATQFWNQMNARGENFTAALPQVAMTGGTLQLPHFNTNAYNIMRAQAETGDRANPDITTATLSITARDLEWRQHIVQNLLDDSPVGIEAELRREAPIIAGRTLDEALLLGDVITPRANNVNGVTYTAPASGADQPAYNWGSNGFFRYALADANGVINANEQLSATNTEDHLDDLRNLLGWGAQDPTNAFYICGIRVRQQIRRFATTYKTLDNVGAIASALTGDVNLPGNMRIYTPRVYPSGSLATGLRDSQTEANNNTDTILAVTRDLCRLAIRRLPRLVIYPVANLAAEGIYPGVRMRMGLGVKGRNPVNGQVVENVLLPDERSVCMIRNITRA